MHGSTAACVKDKLRDPEILLCLRLSVNGYRDIWASFSIVKEEILDEMNQKTYGKQGIEIS